MTNKTQEKVERERRIKGRKIVGFEITRESFGTLIRGGLPYQSFFFPDSFNARIEGAGELSYLVPEIATELCYYERKRAKKRLAHPAFRVPLGRMYEGTLGRSLRVMSPKDIVVLEKSGIGGFLLKDGMQFSQNMREEILAIGTGFAFNKAVYGLKRDENYLRGKLLCFRSVDADGTREDDNFGCWIQNENVVGATLGSKRVLYDFENERFIN